MKTDWKEFDQFAGEKLKEAHVPGAQVCIMKDNEVLYQRSFGFKDPDNLKPIDDDTMFGIASMSKSTVALCCAILEQEGKLSFDDPAVKYFPDLHIPGTPDESVLLRHLANHTTGIPPLPILSWSLAWFTGDDPCDKEENEKLRNDSPCKGETIEEIIGFISNSGSYKAMGAPGEYMSYLNEGFALLSYVVDQAAGVPYEEFVRDRIFRPLGMEKTTLSYEEMFATGDYTGAFYYHGKDKVMQYSENFHIAPPYRGCGWVKSTAYEMCRYYQALSQKGMIDGKQVIPAAAVERLVGREFPETAKGVYCLGLNKRTWGDTVICDHSGALKGVATRGAFIKDGGFSVTCFTNLSGADTQTIVNAAFNAYLGYPLEDSHPWAVPCGKGPSDPGYYIGSYGTDEDPGEPDMVVSQDGNGSLQMTHGDEKFTLLYCSETTFLKVPEGKTEKDGQLIWFFVRDGRAWGFKLGSRIILRKK